VQQDGRNMMKEQLSIYTPFLFMDRMAEDQEKQKERLDKKLEHEPGAEVNVGSVNGGEGHVDYKAPISVADDVIVDVSFGDPEGDELDMERVLNWASSFPPGQYQKQVADLFLSEGEIYVVLDKMSIVIPLMDLLRLLERGGLFESAK